jgi:Fe-S-cluster-containing hydrogenase component 2/CRP-like cAMP-binding protein
MLTLPSFTPVPAHEPAQAVAGLLHRPGLQALSPQQVRFEIDMCVGCDRCMLACPVPISSSVTIAELNHATIGGSITTRVANFTGACVMCGSCVPVCPVNNHRDLLMLSLKQRLGHSWDQPVQPADADRLQAQLPQGWHLSTLYSRLREQPIFADPGSPPDLHLLHLAAASRIVLVNPGETFMREGAYGREMYCILEGQVELSLAGPGGGQLPVAVARRSEFLGDHALLTGQPYYAGARAVAPSVLLEITEQTMQRLLEAHTAIRRHFERISSAHSLAHQLRRLALFAGVTGSDLDWIVSQAQARSYEREAALFREEGHEQPARETLHVLLEGFVKVTRRIVSRSYAGASARIIAYRQGGDYFAGGLDMLGDRRGVTVTAITRVRVAEIPRPALLALFQRYPEVAQRFTERLQLYRASQDAAHTGAFEALPQGGMPAGLERVPASAGQRLGLHMLVDDGVIEGTAVLVIDLERCIHCSECEEACARRHGHARMNRKGMVVGNLSIASACRQCEDPVCLLCSRAGIARLPGGEVYITENCIGCGICAERCPYDNISIVILSDQTSEAAPAASTPSLKWQQFSNLFKKGMGREYGQYAPDKWLPKPPVGRVPKPLDTRQQFNAYGEMLKKVAVKCDLCAGYENQACIQACPTEAAFRVNPKRYFGSTEDLLQRRAGQERAE